MLFFLQKLLLSTLLRVPNIEIVFQDGSQMSTYNIGLPEIQIYIYSISAFILGLLFGLKNPLAAFEKMHDRGYWSTDDLSAFILRLLKAYPVIANYNLHLLDKPFRIEELYLVDIVKKMIQLLGIQKEHRVLDIKATNGHVPEIIQKETGADVTGLVYTNKKQYAEDHIPGVRFCVDISECEGPYDRVILAGNPRGAFPQIKKLLTPFGKVFIRSLIYPNEIEKLLNDASLSGLTVMDIKIYGGPVLKNWIVHEKAYAKALLDAYLILGKVYVGEIVFMGPQLQNVI